MNDVSNNGSKKSPVRSALITGGVVLLAILLIGILVWPQIQLNLNQPASLGEVQGTVYPITPNPRPFANGTAAGKADTKVMIDVYEDFQCPACRQFTMVVEPEIMRNLVASGKVGYKFHSFLIIDRATWDSPKKESHQAANAAMCAADQGRFWDYHDILFNNWTGENVGDFTDPRLVAYARVLNLDSNKFFQCFSANKFKQQIDADMAAGVKLGIEGTPSVFVNGQQVMPGYVPSYADILEALKPFGIQ